MYVCDYYTIITLFYYFIRSNNEGMDSLPSLFVRRYIYLRMKQGNNISMINYIRIHQSIYYYLIIIL